MLQSQPPIVLIGKMLLRVTQKNITLLLALYLPITAVNPFFLTFPSLLRANAGQVAPPFKFALIVTLCFLRVGFHGILFVTRYTTDIFFV